MGDLCSGPLCAESSGVNWAHAWQLQTCRLTGMLFVGRGHDSPESIDAGKQRDGKG